MPVRFTTPSLGGQGELQVADLAAHQWRIALGYRHLHADQLFVGTQLLPTNNWSAWRWRYPSAILHWWAARSATCSSPCPPKLGVVKRTGIQPCANDCLGRASKPTPIVRRATG